MHNENVFFSYFSSKTYVVGTQKNGSFEYPKNMLNLMGKKYFQFYAKYCIYLNLCIIFRVGKGNKLRINEPVANKRYVLMCGHRRLRSACTSVQSDQSSIREGSGSVVECLTRDRGVAGSSLTGVTLLWSLSKTHLS